MEDKRVRIKCLINYSCLLCSVPLQDAKDRYAVNGRSSLDILGSIRSLPWNVDVEGSSHVCRKCLSRLKKKINLEQSLSKCLSELREVYPTAVTAPQPHSSTPLKQCAPNPERPLSHICTDNTVKPSSVPVATPSSASQSETNQPNVSKTEVTVGVFILYFD